MCRRRDHGDALLKHLFQICYTQGVVFVEILFDAVYRLEVGDTLEFRLCFPAEGRKIASIVFVVWIYVQNVDDMVGRVAFWNIRNHLRVQPDLVTGSNNVDIRNLLVDELIWWGNVVSNRYQPFQYLSLSIRLAITEFRKRVFPKDNPGFLIRDRDATHGEIPAKSELQNRFEFFFGCCLSISNVLYAVEYTFGDLWLLAFLLIATGREAHNCP